MFVNLSSKFQLFLIPCHRMYISVRLKGLCNTILTTLFMTLAHLAGLVDSATSSIFAYCLNFLRYSHVQIDTTESDSWLRFLKLLKYFFLVFKEVDPRNLKFLSLFFQDSHSLGTKILGDF